MQCQLYFEMLPQQFSRDSAKVMFILSLLSGNLDSLYMFVAHFKAVFSTSASTLSVHDELWNLQADHSIHEYTLHFHMLAASSGWIEVAFLSAYRRSLHPILRWQMAIYDDSIGLESCLLKAQHVSQHDESFSDDFPAPEPMQTNRYHLSTNERQCCIGQRLCLYCGDNGNLLQTCPVHPPHTVVSTALIHSVMKTPHYHDAVLIHTS